MPRFRGFRKFTLWVVGIVSVIVLVAVVVCWQVGRIGQRQLDVATAKLDVDEPDWQLDAILDQRKKAEPPVKENSAPLILELAERIPDDWRKWRNTDESAGFPARRADNRLPSQEAIAAAHNPAADTLVVRTDAIRLRDQRTGQVPLTIAADPIASTLPHLDKCRVVVSLLQYDGVPRGDPEEPQPRHFSSTGCACRRSRDR